MASGSVDIDEFHNLDLKVRFYFTDVVEELSLPN
jgi:hypothetical protein